MEPGRVIFRHFLGSMMLLLSLAACNSNSADEDAVGKAPIEKPKASKNPLAAPAEKPLGTPMAERVAILGLLNKRNGNARDLELKPGQYIRMGKIEVRLRACERTAPWETYTDHGAFIQLILFERPPGTNDSPRWRQVFSGWLFKENPAANVVQHPIYDVWVKECRMSFPGEEEDFKPTDAPESAERPAAKKPSNAPQSAPAEPEEEDEEPAVEEQTVETT